MYVAVVRACMSVHACMCGEGHLHDTNYQLIYQLKAQMAYSYCSRAGTNAKFGFHVVVLHIRPILECEERLAYIRNGVIHTLWFPNLLIRD